MYGSMVGLIKGDTRSLDNGSPVLCTEQARKDVGCSDFWGLGAQIEDRRFMGEGCC